MKLIRLTGKNSEPIALNPLTVRAIRMCRDRDTNKLMAVVHDSCGSWIVNESFDQIVRLMEDSLS